jgi:hypothetical protein
MIDGLSFDPSSFQYDRFSAIPGGPKGISLAGRCGAALGGANAASRLSVLNNSATPSRSAPIRLTLSLTPRPDF